MCYNIEKLKQETINTEKIIDYVSSPTSETSNTYKNGNLFRYNDILSTVDSIRQNDQSILSILEV